MGSKWRKEWKNRGKVTIFFRKTLFCYSRLSKVSKNDKVTKLLPKRRGRERWAERENSRACTRSARLPTAMLFFCCHKCHVFSVRCRISMKCRGIRNFVCWSVIEIRKKWVDLSLFGVFLPKIFVQKRRVVSHKPTCCFSQNDVLFLIKRRVVFHKTTWCFSSNNVLFWGWNLRILF